MATNQNSATVLSSAASSHSSGSKGSLFCNSGTPQDYHKAQARPEPTRSGSIAQPRPTSNPSEYTLPGVVTDTYALYAIASARIYHSTQLTSNHSGSLSIGRSHGNKDKPSGSQWTYSHLKGTLVFGRDRSRTTSEGASVERIVAQSQGETVEPNGELWFQLIDDEAEKVIWKFKIPPGSGVKLQYELDRPFFHVFQGSSRKYGFLFYDDKEAATFSGEVTSRTTATAATTSKPLKNRSRSLSIKSNKKPKSKGTSPPPPSTAGIATSMISSPAPDSFKHVAHIGFNKTSGAIETSKNLDPSFREILADLQVQTGSTVTESVVLEHLDFVQGFWKDVGTVQRSASSRPVAAN